MKSKVNLFKQVKVELIIFVVLITFVVKTISMRRAGKEPSSSQPINTNTIPYFGLLIQTDDYNWEVKGTVTMVTLCHAFTAIQCLENIEKRRNPLRLNYNAILAFSTISVKQRKFGTTRSIYAIKKDLERNSQNEYTRSTLNIAILTFYPPMTVAPPPDVQPIPFQTTDKYTIGPAFYISNKVYHRNPFREEYVSPYKQEVEIVPRERCILYYNSYNPFICVESKQYMFTGEIGAGLIQNDMLIGVLAKPASGFKELSVFERIATNIPMIEDAGIKSYQQLLYFIKGCGPSPEEKIIKNYGIPELMKFKMTDERSRIIRPNEGSEPWLLYDKRL